MSKGARLLAAVVASPDDDAPRRAYADWLKWPGRDRARGELIHVQCDLAAIDPDTDDPRLRDRLWDLRKRERALWGEHWYRWKTEADVGDPFSVEFERGFPVACVVETAAEWARVAASTVRKVRVRPTVALAAPGPLPIHSLDLQTGYGGDDGFKDERRAAVLARVATSGLFPVRRGAARWIARPGDPRRVAGRARQGARRGASPHRVAVPDVLGGGRRAAGPGALAERAAAREADGVSVEPGLGPEADGAADVRPAARARRRCVARCRGCAVRSRTNGRPLRARR